MARARRRTFLRQWREYREISLEKAGAAIGVSHGHLSKIERGLRQYTQDQIEGLAELYGTDLVSLLAVNPSNPETAREIEFRDLLHGMSPEAAQKALAMLRLLRQ